MLHQLKTQWKWFSPLAFLLIFLPFSPKLDLAVASYFYPFSDHWLLAFMYRYGEWFGFVIFFGAIVLFCIPSFKQSRRGALLVALTIFLGAGVITNSVCKQYLGRPRPKQLTQFDGPLEYRNVWSPNLSPNRIKQKSFPSGHVAMGFSSLALVVAFKRRPYLKIFSIVLTCFWGGGLMLTRVAQGGHFLSDVIVSPCLMWWVTLFIDKALHWAERRNIKIFQRLFTSTNDHPII